MMTGRRVCVIPARGGSKRIEKKNIRPFCGKPIILYSMAAALESGCFDEVMVSTDDPETADLARRSGASVPFMRDSSTAGDNAGLADVLVEVLQCYKFIDKSFDLMGCILATAPLLMQGDLREAVAQMSDSECDAVISACRFAYPIQRAIVEREGKARMKWPQYYQSRSQDLEPAYHDAGQFYIVRTQPFLRERKLFLRRLRLFKLPESRVQDIDTEEDWKIAEQKYRLLNGL